MKLKVIHAETLLWMHSCLLCFYNLYLVFAGHCNNWYLVFTVGIWCLQGHCYNWCLVFAGSLLVLQLVSGVCRVTVTIDYFISCAGSLLQLVSGVCRVTVTISICCLLGYCYSWYLVFAGSLLQLVSGVCRVTVTNGIWCLQGHCRLVQLWWSVREVATS